MPPTPVPLLPCGTPLTMEGPPVRTRASPWGQPCPPWRKDSRPWLRDVSEILVTSPARGPHSSAQMIWLATPAPVAAPSHVTTYPNLFRLDIH